ncbi:MAG: Iron hydrogenase small subunit [Candidatus Diapherotrites archaeon ADurb.Bin253]|jgi:hypothetical protein|nr:MAG: Iron hydrogenase small subunit [Candidatus Diapherotrites archaeon ADurb.Bin253]
MRKYRRSHEKPIVKDIYKKYLGKPLSRKAATYKIQKEG